MSGRPALTPGAHGRFRTRQVTKLRKDGQQVTVWRAVTNFGDYDGHTRRIERYGPTRAKAEARLQDALAARRPAGMVKLTASSRFAEAAEVWMARLAARNRAPTTLDTYRQRLDSVILPAIGGLRLRECTVTALEAFTTAQEQRETARGRRGTSANWRRSVRGVVSGVLAVAVRHGALPANPVRDMEHIEDSQRRRPRALLPAERDDLLAKLDADPRAVSWDLPDLFRFLFGTGLRVGEALAVRWCDLDLDGIPLDVDGQTVRVPVVSVTGHIVRVKGRGLVRLGLHDGGEKDGRAAKTERGERTLALPGHVVTMLRVRRPSWAAEDDPVFPTSVRTWREPSGVSRLIRATREAAGYPWVTSHTCRKTATTELRREGLPDEVVADVLGHSKVSTLAKDVYTHRGAVHPTAAAVLDAAYRGR